MPERLIVHVPTRPLTAAFALGVSLVVVLIAVTPGGSRATVHRPAPTRRQAALCLTALSRGAARAVPGDAPVAVASAFGVFARGPRASDGLASTVRLSLSLGAVGAAAYYPAAVRLLRRDRQDALYVLPAMLAPRRVPGACRYQLHALAAQIVQDPSVSATGLGVCMVETLTVNGGPGLGAHPESASAACLPLRSLGSYAEILPRIEDAGGHEYMLVPDSVAAIAFQFSGHRMQTVISRDNLARLPGPVSFTTGPQMPTVDTFSRHLSALLPVRITMQGRSHPRPFGLVARLSHVLLAEARLLALTGGAGPFTWRL